MKFGDLILKVPLGVASLSLTDFFLSTSVGELRMRSESTALSTEPV